MSRRRELPSWDELAVGEGPFEARIEYGFITPAGKRVWGVRAHAGVSHDRMATRRLGIKAGLEGGGESWHSPAATAVHIGHVRYMRVPKAPEYRTAKHMLNMELNSKHRGAVEHALDLVKQHATDEVAHSVYIDFLNHGDHDPECNRAGGRGLTPSQAEAHLMKHLRGGCTTSIAAARQFQFGGDQQESVVMSRADQLIQARLAEALSQDALLAMARKAKESAHAGEREAFSSKLKSMGHDPDALLRGASGQARQRRTTSSGPTYGPRRPDSAGTPEWAWAGYSGGMPPSHNIYRPTYEDLNHIKKTMWEKSGKSKAEWSTHQFDGSFFRNTFTAFGNEKIHPEMAKAMLHWGDSEHGSGGNRYPTKAIFASKRSDPKTLHLLWANGQHVRPGVKLAVTTRSHHDHQFTDRLPEWIDSQVPPGA